MFWWFELSVEHSFITNWQITSEIKSADVGVPIWSLTTFKWSLTFAALSIFTGKFKPNSSYTQAWVYDELGLNFPVKILNAAKVNDHLKVVNDQIGTPTSADFISEVICQFVMKECSTLSSNHQNIYNLVPNGSSSWFEFAKFLLDHAEKAGFNLKCKSKNIIPINTS